MDQSQVYPNPYKFPPLESLKAMSARDIGLLVLRTVRLPDDRPVVPIELVTGLVDKYAPRNSGALQLFMEGVSYLISIGYLVEGSNVGDPTRKVALSRIGAAAAMSSSKAAAFAARAIPSEELLHPVIVAKALSEADRGPDSFDTAIFNAYHALEVAVREAGGFGNDKIGVKLMSAAFGPGGPLRDSTADDGEAEAMRALFAGAVGYVKNPLSHRIVGERDPRHTMRLLMLASLLLEVLDRRSPIYIPPTS